MNSGYGIKIENKIQIKNIVLLIGGEKEIIILPQNLSKPEACAEFYIVLKHFFKKIQSDSTPNIFGLFFDFNLNLFRKKIKKEFIENFSESNLFALINDDNVETYYQNIHESLETLGIEIRFETCSQNWGDRDADIGEIIGKIRDGRIHNMKKNNG